tara:strand:+ start:185 stop:1411 length:1227 start_codon:yes stop_codon:yes gene_type:complete
MKRTFKFLLGIGILLAGFAVCALLWITRPEAPKSDQVAQEQVVKFLPINPRDLSFDIPSQGIVESSRRTTLAAEVPGRVEKVSRIFEIGKEVTEGDVLIELDPTDYLAILAQSKATLADAKSALASEMARATQAKRDWVTQGKGGEASVLMRREPQLASARARVESAEAAKEKADKDVERTVIKAPFNAIISSTFTEVGSYLTPGAPIAEMFETGPYEVRLPISVDELAFLKHDDKGRPSGKARIRTTVSGKAQLWSADIIRSEGEIDRQTRSLYVVAAIGSPEKDSNNSNETLVDIRPGLFIEASIAGREVKNVIAVPFSSFIDLEENQFHVVTVDQANTIRFREVDILHREQNTVFVRGSFQKGDKICLTEVPDVREGLPVVPKIADPEELIRFLDPSHSTITSKP